MRYTDIAIIGGGLAGSTAAAMLGRAGIPTLLIDPHENYPFDFRVEKLRGGTQVDLLYKTGFADSLIMAIRAEIPKPTIPGCVMPQKPVETMNAALRRLRKASSA